MIVTPFDKSDIEKIPSLQPPDWKDLRIFFQYYLKNLSFCIPLKISAEGNLAAIGAAILHKEVVWLAHIVVHPEFRNRGMGGRITQALIDCVNKSQYKTIGLVATSLGEPVYKRLGFIIDNEYIFLKNEKPNLLHEVSDGIKPFHQSHAEEIIMLDRKISGEDRSSRLQEYINDSFVFMDNNKVAGFYFPTFGEGLILAENPGAGIELMKLRNKTHDFAILPLENKTAIEFLTADNFKSFRKAKRMYLGEKRNWHPEMMYNRVNGQIG